MSELHSKFGELLKLERQRKGLKLEDLADQLKISQGNLEHIESGDISALPSKIYYNLFAKSYAEALGIDYERTIEAIKEDLGDAIENGEPEVKATPGDKKKTKPKKEKPAKEPTDEASFPLKKLLYLFGGIVAAFILFLVIYFVFFSPAGDSTGEQTPVDEPPVVSQEQTETVDEGEDSDYDWNITDYEEPQMMKLRLVSRNQSWSTVLADGDTALFRNLNPGRIYEVEAMYRLIVSVGIPSQVDIELNGQPVDLRDPETGRISRVEINQVNLEEILAGPVEAPQQPVVEDAGEPAPVSSAGNDTSVSVSDTGGSDDD